MKKTLFLTAFSISLAACGGVATHDNCANWSCGSSSQCATVMGAPSGSQCGFSSLTACQDWCSQYIPGNCSCGSGGGGGGGSSNPIDNVTALQVLPGQSFYACSDSLGSSFMPQTPLAVGGNPTSSGYSWSIPAGQSLPAGLTVQVDSGTGVLTGTIATNVVVGAGDYPLDVTVSDGQTSHTGSVTLHVVNDGGLNQPPYHNGHYAIGTHLTRGLTGYSSCPVGYGPAAPDVVTTLPSVFANQKYGANAFVAGVANPSWGLQPLYAGAQVTHLPPGLQLNPVNGTIYGAVDAGTAATNFSFTAVGAGSYSGGNQTGNGYSTKGGAAYVISVTN